jgi:Flp pilus assembly protein TadD
MRSLRSGVALTALAMMWSSAAFGFNLFGSSDESKEKPKPAPQAQTQQQPKQDAAADSSPTLAKTLAANLDGEIAKAKAERLSGDYGAAAHAFAQMVLVAPDNAEVCGEYGKTLVLLGRSDDAIAFLKRAIDLKPNDWTYYSAIGAAFDQKSEFADAKTAYQRGLQLNPTSAALLNNYAMSRMLAGDLPAAQALIAQAKAAGNDPKITSNAELMANLRGQQTAEVAPPRATPAAAPSVAPAAALPKPVATVKLPPPAPQPVKTATAVPAPAKTAPANPVAQATPAPAKTASAEKPVIVKTETGRVMMQAVPKDPQAGPVKTAETAEPAATPAAPAQEAKADATGAPRTLASAAPAPAAHSTPDLRAASD